MRRSLPSALLFLSLSCGMVHEQPYVTSDLSSSAITDTAKKPLPFGDNFLGKIRADVKTSYVDVPADTFKFIKELRNWLPDDERMHKYSDARFNDKPRCAEENHNIVITDAYIFGVKREEDNDFHVILGTSRNIDKQQPFFSAEISGLPASSSPYYATLKSVRDQFKDFFGDDAKKEYVFVASAKTPPIHLKCIRGSLFFDNHHYSGHSSVQGYKVFTAWEMHPVTAITFGKSR
jgi:hypothetical protein